MGRTYTAECNECNRVFNFDVGIGKVYSEKQLLNLENDFNLLTLYNGKNRSKEIQEFVNKGKCKFDGEYGQFIVKCDTCDNLYTRFMFILSNENGAKYESRYNCHQCRKKLKIITESELLKNYLTCPYCKRKIKFHLSGNWN